MTCAACKRSANADSSRYGKLWCTECVAAIEFEERLARQNHMVVADVFVERGHLAVLLAYESGRTPSRWNLESVAVTETDILRELRDAVVSFRQNVRFVGDRLFVTHRDATPTARQLLAVISKYKPLLGPAERESADHFQRIARMVVGDVH